MSFFKSFIDIVYLSMAILCSGAMAVVRIEEDYSKVITMVIGVIFFTSLYVLNQTWFTKDEKGGKDGES